MVGAETERGSKSELRWKHMVAGFIPGPGVEFYLPRKKFREGGDRRWLEQLPTYCPRRVVGEL